MYQRNLFTALLLIFILALSVGCSKSPQELPSFTTYEGTSVKFKVKYPADWSKKPDIKQQTVCVTPFAAPDNATSIMVMTNTNIFTEDLDEVLEGVKGQLVQKKYTVETVEKAELGKQPAYKITAKGKVVSSQGKEVDIQQIWHVTVNKGTLVCLIATAEPAKMKESEKIFAESQRTFELPVQ